MYKCKYDSWTVKVLSDEHLCLIIDGINAASFLSAAAKDMNSREEHTPSVVSSLLKSVERFENDTKMLKVKLKDVSVNLNSNSFKATSVFGCVMYTAEDLLDFWNKCGPFLLDTNTDSNLGAGKESLEFSLIPEDQPFSQQQLDVSRRNSTIPPSLQYEGIPCNAVDVNSTSVKSTDANTSEERCTDQINKEETLNNDSFDRQDIFKNIMEKNVGHFYLDIFKIRDPPNEYKVRSRNDDFVRQISELMITKNSVSIENAPNIIGLVLINKAEFTKDKLEETPIYAVDGNHSIYAQRMAYKKTKDPLFRYRSVNIYCNLTPEEALILGISRNEDASNVLQFSDFEKVDLVRRQLYILSKTPSYDEPPEPTSEFSKMYRTLLNLNEKSKVDAKAVIRFLATKLSKRCYRLYTDICKKGQLIKASKFECMRGLNESDQFINLTQLARSNLTRLDWRLFKEVCMEKKNLHKNKTAEYMLQIEFHDDHATFTTKQKGDLIIHCFRFLRDGQEILTTYTELEDLLFGKQKQKFMLSPTAASTPRKRRRCRNERVTEAKRRSLSVMVSDSDGLLQNDGDMSTSFISDSDTDIDFNGNDKATPNTENRCPAILVLPNPESVTSDKSVSLTSKRNIYSFSSYISPLKDTREHIQLQTSSSDTSSFIASDVFINNFLLRMADEAVVNRVVCGQSQIEEEEVETKPENLLPYAKDLLDLSLQKESKPFFTEDAWLLVNNSLSVLREMYTKEPKKMKGNTNDARKATLQIPVSSTSSKTLSASSPDISLRTTNPKQPTKIEENTNDGKKEHIPLQTFSSDTSSLLAADIFVKNFLLRMADEAVVNRVVFSRSQIEEEEVETKPENLLPYAKDLLDLSLQKESKPFFTEDAWLLVNNSLSVLRGMYTKEPKEMKGNTNDARIATKQVPVSSVSSKTSSTLSRDTFARTKNPKQPTKIEENTNDGKKEMYTKETTQTMKKTNAGTKENLKDCRIRLTDITSIEHLQKYFNN